MASRLSAEEEQATKQFLEEINKWTSQHGVSPLSWDVAVKFLMARKFDVLRAIELFHSYRETRLREGIVKLQPHEEPLRSELLSGKFTVLGVRDPSGASIALYTAKLHHPSKTGNHVVLQALFYLLDRAVESWNLQLLSEQNGRVDPVDELVGIPLENTSIHVPGPEAMGLAELMAHLNRAQRSGIYLEYEELRREQPPGTFTCALAVHNQERNRYGDVLCLDQTRVRLKARRNERSDYINASFMDGYKQKNAYIGTQGPLEKTYGDFWRMVWEQSVLVIVMTTRTDEGGRRKCGQYWPKEEGGQEVYGHIAVVNHRVDKQAHYNQTTLELHNTETFEQRQVTHFQFLSWPDYGVPSSALSLIDFLGAVKHQQQWAVQAFGSQWRGHPLGPPMLQDVGTLNVCQTVRRMRAQRAFSIQTPEQYYFCHTAILEHAQRRGLLSTNQ
ncbi:hypothetical protein cypCar_00004660 [Cyprinus carpio]|nr:hypothetical protein cypCar_00004660 [Cyprinus carpio]